MARSFAGADLGVAILRETDLSQVDLSGVDLSTTLLPKGYAPGMAKENHCLKQSAPSVLAVAFDICIMCGRIPFDRRDRPMPEIRD